MKKSFLFALLAVVTSAAHAQVSTSLLTCIPHQKGAPQFSVEFGGLTARLTLKLNVFNISYIGAFVDKNGDRWSIYENKEIRVSTTIPNDMYVSIGSGTGNNYNVISGAHCK